MKKLLLLLSFIPGICFAQIPTHCGNVTSPIAFQSTDVSQCYAQACMNAHITTISGTPTTICTGWFPFVSTDFRQLFCALKEDSGGGNVCATIPCPAAGGTNGEILTWSGANGATWEAPASACSTIPCPETSGTGGQVLTLSSSSVAEWATPSFSGLTSFSSGNLSPLFITSVANPTTTPALSFSLTNQSPNTFFAGGTSGTFPSAPTFRKIFGIDLPVLIDTTHSAGTGLTDLSAGRNLEYGITNTAVTPGSYTSTNLTVNAQGQITAASNGTAAKSYVKDSAWLLTGNSGTTPGTNYIGTNDGQALEFKVFGGKAGWIDYAFPYNTSFGDSALVSLTTGFKNVAIGKNAMENNTTGSYNTGVSYKAFHSNTIGNRNTAVGDTSMWANISGNNNTAVGYGCLTTNTTASSNVAIGNYALYKNNGDENTAIGDSALLTNTTGIGNVGVGYQTLQKNTTGTNNIALGTDAMQANTTGASNIAIGENALNTNTTHNYCSSVGFGSLQFTNASMNTAFGYDALNLNTTGVSNTGFGYEALMNKATSGSECTAIGDSAGYTLTTGEHCTFIGSNSDASVNNINNSTAIGYQASVGVSNIFQLGNSAITKISTNGSYIVTGTGNGLIIPAGTNCRTGTATLTGGTVTIANTAVTSSSIIFVSYNTPTAAPGFLSAPTASISAGVQFVINSTNVADNTSTVNWWILN